MPIPAVNSAFDVANWFFKKSDSEGLYLETEKLQHLIFLAQMHYSLLHEQGYLVPSLLSVTTPLCRTPLQKALSFGRPLMEAPEFSADINEFLSLICKIFAHEHQSPRRVYQKLRRLFRLLPNGRAILSMFPTLPPGLKAASPPRLSTMAKHFAQKDFNFAKRPVVVSKWSPRKLSPKNSK
jgi:hypothetical protein